MPHETDNSYAASLPCCWSFCKCLAVLRTKTWMNGALEQTNTSASRANHIPSPFIYTNSSKHLAEQLWGQAVDAGPRCLQLTLHDCKTGLADAQQTEGCRAQVCTSGAAH